MKTIVQARTIIDSVQAEQTLPRVSGAELPGRASGMQAQAAGARGEYSLPSQRRIAEPRLVKHR